MASASQNSSTDRVFDYLAGLDGGTYQRGERYFAQGAVRSLSGSIAEGSVTAKVQGSSLYDVVLECVDGTWEGDCTCPVEIDCKHCCAAMLAALDRESGDGKAVETPAQRKRAPRAKSVSSFSTIVQEKLGRKLRNQESRAVRAVTDAYERFRATGNIPEHVLQPILGGTTGWGWNTWEVWPEAPNDVWEAWLYIAHCLRQRKLQPLPFLAQITDPGEVDALVAGWEQRKLVEHWRTELQARADQSEEPVDEMDFRLRLNRDAVQLESREGAAPDFSIVKKGEFDRLISLTQAGRLKVADTAYPIWQAFAADPLSGSCRKYAEPSVPRLLNRVLRMPELRDRILNPRGELFRPGAVRLRWRLDAPATDDGVYGIVLEQPDGTAPPPLIVAVDGRPSLYVAAEEIFEVPPLEGLHADCGRPNLIPAAALESSEGVVFLGRLGLALPDRIAERVVVCKMRVLFRCSLETNPYGGGERLVATVSASPEGGRATEEYSRDGWRAAARPKPSAQQIINYDRSAQRTTPHLVSALRLTWSHYTKTWERTIGKKFPDEFSEWLSRLPDNFEVELDAALASLRDAPISASVKLDVEEAGIDWFDLRVALDVSDTELTAEELKLLLNAKGSFVRLGTKGWRRLQLQLSAEDEEQMANLGLNARDFSSEPQRLHALQLAGKSNAKLLPEHHAEAIQRRAAEIQTRVVPPVPAAIRGELRPYQIEGFHFLAYLSTNRFGGILADDMGLGKTVQTLAWLAWLADQSPAGCEPNLVVCPKSVVDNWHAEVTRFFPELQVHGWGEGGEKEGAPARGELVVINYTQLRLLEKTLCATRWNAVILDEAQYIKNPQSQTARAAFRLPAAHRLALSGTPIENRLLDLWSIMAFAMPGVLGKQTHFSKTYDQRTDPLSRRRLAARVRPFVLRRTKTEVARDLPDRIEEDLLCELEGVQATLYRAELKRARLALLKIKTSSELDKARFNILTSLLRLRQICCHPALVSEQSTEAESSKLVALLDLLEPLVEEGHKVLVFSQFVRMLALIKAQIAGRGWPDFLLTGETENRGELVRQFQGTDGAAVFLISLRAGGFGLNLTAASYVVLYDPWWNPAVENQAIDRTHRIGQTSKVIAYRLLVKNSIEEKIRALQKQKSALSADILGEESFARGLSMEDFQFLLAE